MARRRVAHEGGHDNSERWLLTYSDLITLLLALFVVLFAMSSISLQKFYAFKTGLTASFNPSALQSNSGVGVLSQSALAQSSQQEQQPNPLAPNASSSLPKGVVAPNTIAKEIRAALKKAGLSQYAQVSVTRQGAIVSILADRVFFATDSASLGVIGERIVDVIAGVVRAKANAILVEGYTDNVPITGGPYSSNWELSAARAANVVARLHVVDKIAETRMAAVGYGDTHPAATNATSQGRAENRRIDVAILNTTEAG